MRCQGLGDRPAHLPADEAGCYAEAEKLALESLDCWRRLRGLENSWVIKSMKDLIRVLSREARYAEAEKLARDSANISRRACGQENPISASSVFTLGAIEAHRWNRPEALPPSDAIGMESNPDLKS